MKELIIFILGFTLQCSARALAENSLVIAGQEDWHSIFTSKANVDFDTHHETKGGVKGILFYRPHTFVQIKYTEADAKIVPFPSKSLWNSLKNVMTIKLGYQPTADEWRRLAASDYVSLSGKPDADGFITPWPTIDPFFVFPDKKSPFPGAVDLFVCGIFEGDGYLVPIVIYGKSPKGSRDLYLFDNQDSNDIFYSTLTACFKRSPSGLWLFTDFEGLSQEKELSARRSIMQAVSGMNSLVIDLWMDPVLDRYLPPLTRHPRKP